MSFHALPFSILIGGLTSCYQSMTFMLYGCSDHQPHMNRFGLSSYFILWGGCNYGGLCKGRTLP
jgi:hypothetical protein